jgi:hypothetical protein
MKKTIVVLADSVKSKGRCLAGKELVWEGKAWKVGGWIRPVSTAQGSEVPIAQMVDSLGREPALLEIIEVPLASAVPLPDQPENWLIDSGQKWRRVDSMDFSQAGTLVDRPRQVWGEGRGWRRVAAGYVQKMPKPASLYLIKPEEIVSVEVWSEPNRYEPPPAVKRHRVAKLRYGGIVHDFDIDDPVFSDRYYPRFPGVNAGRKQITLRAPTETLVCVSLTLPYRGNHYKIAAAFVEPQLK